MRNPADPTANGVYPARGDDVTRYDGLSIALHWMTAALVFVQFGLAETREVFPRTMWHLMIVGHMSFGLLLAAVIMLRIFWRLTFGRHLLEAGQGFIQFVARAVHYILYLLVVVEVASGFLTHWTHHKPLSFFGLLLPSPFGVFSKATGRFVDEIHDFGAWTIMALVASHALAALGHHYVLRDRVLRRMLPGHRT